MKLFWPSFYSSNKPTQSPQKICCKMAQYNMTMYKLTPSSTLHLCCWLCWKWQKKKNSKLEACLLPASLCTSYGIAFLSCLKLLLGLLIMFAKQEVRLPWNQWFTWMEAVQLLMLIIALGLRIFGKAEHLCFKERKNPFYQKPIN